MHASADTGHTCDFEPTPDARPGAGEPIATTIVAWVMVLLVATGLLIWNSTRGHYKGMEDLLVAVTGIAGLILAFCASGVGVLIGGIGLVLARRREVRYRPLTAAFALNLLVFAAFVILVVVSASTRTPQPPPFP